MAGPEKIDYTVPVSVTLKDQAIAKINATATDITRAAAVSVAIAVDVDAGDPATYLGLEVKAVDIVDMLKEYLKRYSRVRRIVYNQSYNDYSHNNPPSANIHVHPAQTAQYTRYATVDISNDPSHLPAPTTTYSAVAAGQPIDINAYNAIILNLQTQLDTNFEILTYTITYCHSSCHTNCHSSRGRR